MRSGTPGEINRKPERRRMTRGRKCGVTFEGQLRKKLVAGFIMRLLRMKLLSQQVFQHVNQAECLSFTQIEHVHAMRENWAGGETVSRLSGKMCHKASLVASLFRGATGGIFGEPAWPQSWLAISPITGIARTQPIGELRSWVCLGFTWARQRVAPNHQK